LLDELEDARKRADSLDQLSAVVKAISEKAKISGLLVQKMGVGSPDYFSTCNSIEEIVDEMLSYRLNASYQTFTEEDRQYFIDLMNRFFAESTAYIEGIKPGPSTEVKSQRSSKSANTATELADEAD
jgi:hypothetical protein